MPSFAAASRISDADGRSAVPSFRFLRAMSAGRPDPDVGEQALQRFGLARPLGLLTIVMPGA